MTDSSGAGPTTGFLVADEARVRDALDGLARRIHATLGPDLHLVGIIRRGAPLAREIGRRLGELRDAATDVGTLRLKRYADDLAVIHDEPELDDTELPDFVAMQVDLGEGDVVEVHAPPFEDEWGVWLFHRKDLEEG